MRTSVRRHIRRVASGKRADVKQHNRTITASARGMNEARHELIKEKNSLRGVETSDKKLYAIADKNGLNGRQAEDFVKFITERFKGHYTTEEYATEWAGRFRKRTEWIHSDQESMNILQKIDNEKYATESSRDRYGLFNRNLGGYPKFVACSNISRHHLGSTCDVCGQKG